MLAEIFWRVMIGMAIAGIGYLLHRLATKLGIRIHD